MCRLEFSTVIGGSRRAPNSALMKVYVHPSPAVPTNGAAALRSPPVGDDRVPNGVPNCPQVQSTQRDSERVNVALEAEVRLEFGHF
jgi:hypothetical protein